MTFPVAILRGPPRHLEAALHPLNCVPPADRVASSSGDFLPPSPPAEKPTARQDQAGKSSTGDGTGDWCGIGSDDARKVARGRIVVMEERRVADERGTVLVE